MSSIQEIFTLISLITYKLVDSITKSFDTSILDIDDFHPERVSSWIKVFVQYPRISPINFIISLTHSCYLIRRSFKFTTPIFSLLLTYFIFTVTENFIYLMRGSNLSVFDNAIIAPSVLAGWLLFNYFPFDIIYKCTRSLSLLMYIINGFITGHNLTHGIDQAVDLYPTSSAAILIFGIFAGAAEPIIICVLSMVFNKKCISAGPPLFGISIGALFYYYLTDLGHISNTYWYDKEVCRLFVILGVTFYHILLFLVPEWIFTKIYEFAGRVISYLVPYYGGTWVPTRTKTLVPRPQTQKVKTE